MDSNFERPRNEAEISAETQAVYDRIMTGSHRMEANTEMAGFARYLREKYKSPSATDYTLYHLLAGSTMMPDHAASGFDFPGDDSVEMFLKALEAELNLKGAK